MEHYMLVETQSRGEGLKLGAYRAIANNMKFEVLFAKRSRRRLQQHVNTLQLKKPADKRESRWRSELSPVRPRRPENRQVNTVFDQLDDLPTNPTRQRLTRSLVGHQQNRRLSF